MKKNNDFFEHEEFEAPVREKKAAVKKESAKKAPEKKPAKEGKKKSKTKMVVLIVVLCVVVVAIAAAILLVVTTQKNIAEQQQAVVDQIKNIEVFHEGVVVDGVEVTGLTKEQAKEYIEAAHAEEISDMSYTIVPNDAFAQALAAQEQRAAEEAAEMEKIAEEAAEAAENAATDADEEEVVADDGVLLDENGEAVEIEQTEETEKEEEPKLYTVDESGNYLINAECIKFEYNIDEVLDEAFALAKEGTYEELLAEVEDIKTNGRVFETTKTLDVTGTKAAIEQLAEDVFVEAVNAEIVFNTDFFKETEAAEDSEDAQAAAPEKFKYTDEIMGVAIDAEATYAALEVKAEANEFGDVEMVTIETAPETTVEDLKGTITLRGSEKTEFKGSYGYANRVWNITKASGLINGVILQPGEVFSMNDTLGVRTEKNGWKLAGALSGGQSGVKQAGGGVCQVSSTLYNAVVKADLEIVYRQAHSEKLGYVPGGLDATINSVGNEIDFEWKNNTNSPVIIVSYIDADNYTVYTDIYGEPFSTTEYDEIRLSSERIGTVDPPGEMKYQLVEGKSASYKEVKVSRKSGSVWQSYKEYYKDGELVKKEKLAKTTYKAYAGLTLVGQLPDASPSASAEESEKTKKPEKEEKTKKPEKEEKTKKPEKEDKTKEPTKAPTQAPTPDPNQGSGSDSGANSGNDSGAASGGDSGANSGGDSGANSGNDSGANSGGDSGANSGGDSGAVSGGDSGAAA